MWRRILAWIVLAGFVLLLANIIFIGYYRMQSIGIYAFIALLFLFTSKIGKKTQ
ncbi:MAG: hypothetical protein N3I35_11385 [Clostridia bacterium]|nr:hypothetical protein [Clostridia bacterium]